MPEALELRLRGSERRGVPVPEPDHCDAGEEIEVALAVRIDEPRALAVGERDVEPRVRRQQLAARGDVGHATTAVRPIVAVIPLAAASAAARSFGTMPPSNAPSASIRRASTTPIASTTSSST